MGVVIFIVKQTPLLTTQAEMFMNKVKSFIHVMFICICRLPSSLSDKQK